LSNSLRPDEDDEDDVPPEAELGLEDDELELGLDDELAPAADDGEDDLLLCDMEGEALEPLVLFDESAA
jgi:hypothetical protein